MIFSNKLYLIILFIFLSFNCTLDNSIPTLPHNYSMSDNENSIIIGHVSYTALFDKNSNRSKDIFGQHLKKMIYIENISTGAKLYFDFNQEENSPYFVVLLPPGRYVITYISIGNLSIPLFGKLIVDKNKIIYIGNLIYTETHINKKQLFLSIILQGGNLGINGKWTIEDNYVDAINLFKINYPNITQEVTKSIITLLPLNSKSNK